MTKWEEMREKNPEASVPWWIFLQYQEGCASIIGELMKTEAALKTYRIALDNISERASHIDNGPMAALIGCREEADHALEQVKLMKVREAD